MPQAWQPGWTCQCATLPSHRHLPGATAVQLNIHVCTFSPCRAVDLALGAPINSFVITARECTRALARDRLRNHPGMLTRLAVATDLAAVEFRMTALRLLTWLASLQLELEWLLWGGRRAVVVSGLPSAAAA